MLRAWETVAEEKKKNVDLRCLGELQHLYQQKVNKAKSWFEDEIMSPDQHILS